MSKTLKGAPMISRLAPLLQPDEPSRSPVEPMRSLLVQVQFIPASSPVVLGKVVQSPADGCEFPLALPFLSPSIMLTKRV